MVVYGCRKFVQYIPMLCPGRFILVESVGEFQIVQCTNFVPCTRINTCSVKILYTAPDCTLQLFILVLSTKFVHYSSKFYPLQWRRITTHSKNSLLRRSYPDQEGAKGPLTGKVGFECDQAHSQFLSAAHFSKTLVKIDYLKTLLTGKLQSLIRNLDPIFVEAVHFDLFWQQVNPTYRNFVFYCVARNLDDFHTIFQWPWKNHWKHTMDQGQLIFG